MSSEWLHETTLAINAAVIGGKIAKNRRFETVVSGKESFRDVVTAADLAIETCIQEILSESSYPIVGEELSSASDREKLSTDFPVWLVDPIDGTANYVSGFDYYACSVGLATNDRFLLGAICLPERTELFSTLGEGRSLLNGRVIVHNHCHPSESLIAVSFSGATGDSLKRQKQFILFGELNDRSRGCLRLGSAASNICFTAANRFQVAYGFDAHIWDVAAGLAVAINAGCSSYISRSKDGLRIDYIVGSCETVKMIRDKAFAIGLLDAKGIA